ncbi:hypothetical protein CVT26_010992 [Gymnopilus dilepis]|uniref:Neprosin domain-containing protein n=1 Tax=Gymnopilus dilepis TaxID=231916 RepID=A0A409VYE1_9AGAR|nr:hypothetical protein CVT26_010992 [Gymnopilus dilepis]
MFSRSLHIPCIVVALFCGAVSAHAVSPAPEPSLFNPSGTVSAAAAELGVSQLQAGALTNAHRLAAGLPLKAPHRRASRTNAARRTTPSNTPSSNNAQGYIQARDITTGDPKGYLSAVYNEFGQATLTTDFSEALVVSIDLTVSGPISIQTVNGPYASYPFLGAVNGFASTSSIFGTSSYNYAYIGATIETDIGAPAVAAANAFSTIVGQAVDVASGIWYFDSITKYISVQWINPDLSAPVTHLGYSQAAGESHHIQATSA